MIIQHFSRFHIFSRSYDINCYPISTRRSSVPINGSILYSDMIIFTFEKKNGKWKFDIASTCASIHDTWKKNLHDLGFERFKCLNEHSDVVSGGYLSS